MRSPASCRAWQIRRPSRWRLNDPTAAMCASMAVWARGRYAPPGLAGGGRGVTTSLIVPPPSAEEDDAMGGFAPPKGGASAQRSTWDEVESLQP
eukprot:CAMPEP_0182894226 /NCGR_PEP_ID=MMETSP0034_2-20130328/24950_1 /TAXON_ID=156128 /ORGANISM="Nephroselmis pyriformis, Strain CCMP717" /LENGTH=93 /DNA_ID=CAMNT_0025028005 /DNA_START=177 /DNA_END=454 /DNA_ORIENTATION=+